MLVMLAVRSIGSPARRSTAGRRSVRSTAPGSTRRRARPATPTTAIAGATPITTSVARMPTTPTSHALTAAPSTLAPTSSESRMPNTLARWSLGMRRWSVVRASTSVTTVPKPRMPTRTSAIGGPLATATSASGRLAARTATPSTTSARLERAARLTTRSAASEPAPSAALSAAEAAAAHAEDVGRGDQEHDLRGAEHHVGHEDQHERHRDRRVGEDGAHPVPERLEERLARPGDGEGGQRLPAGPQRQRGTDRGDAGRGGGRHPGTGDGEEEAAQRGTDAPADRLDRRHERVGRSEVLGADHPRDERGHGRVRGRPEQGADEAEGGHGDERRAAGRDREGDDCKRAAPSRPRPASAGHPSGR